MIKDAEHFLFEKGFSKSDQKEGYILKVEELIELLDEFEQLNKPVVVRGGDKETHNIQPLYTSLIIEGLNEQQNTPTEPLPAEGVAKSVRVGWGDAFSCERCKKVLSDCKCEQPI